MNQKGSGAYPDPQAKKRILQLPPFQTSIASLSFNATGTKLAVAASYPFEHGAVDHPPDALYLVDVADADVMPKSLRAAAIAAKA